MKVLKISLLKRLINLNSDYVQGYFKESSRCHRAPSHVWNSCRSLVLEELDRGFICSETKVLYILYIKSATKIELSKKRNLIDFLKVLNTNNSFDINN